MLEDVDGLLVLAALDGLLEVAEDGLAADDSPAALPMVPASPGLDEPLEVQWSAMCLTSETLNEFPFAELVLVVPQLVEKTFAQIAAAYTRRIK